MTDRTTVTYPHQQTPPPQSHPVPPPPWMPPPPARRRSRLWWLLLIPAAFVLLCGVLAIGLAASSESPADKTAVKVDGLSQATAQRACRTAIETEWKNRQTSVTSDPDKSNITISTQGIDIEDGWQTGRDWSVDATVRFTLNNWPIDPIVDTLNLTCTASGTDEVPVTAVVNR